MRASALTLGTALLSFLLGMGTAALLIDGSGGGGEPSRAASKPDRADSAGAPAKSPADRRDPSRGKWRPARSDGTDAERWERPEAAEALMAMPYLQGHEPAAGRSGAIRPVRPEAIQPGLNLYTSGHGPEAVLMDRAGRVVHRWAYPLKRFRPELYQKGTVEQIRKVDYFRRARVLPTGELLAIYEGLGLVKLSPDSELLWGYRGGAHHDLDVAADGTIWLLDREGKLLPRIDPDEGVLEDFVTVLGPDGEVRRRISILEAFERSDYAALLERMPDRPDILHTNTIELLDGRLADRHPAFRAGNVLLSVLELDAVVVLDPDSEEIVWALAGLWRKQHQPTIVGDGHLLIFDNLGAPDGGARVLELDPFTQQIAWRYGENLVSDTLGSCQRLANGNTLITESENGRAVEIAPDGAVVWEFRTPHRVVPDEGRGEELVAVLFEVERLPPDFPFAGDADVGAR